MARNLTNHPNTTRRRAKAKQPLIAATKIVAIGASAGGLEALEKFFDNLSMDLGVAFVIIQHLSPDHKSMMDDLLSKHTLMPVKIAENDMEVAPNHVYLIPPAKLMTLTGNKLQLAPKVPHELNLPIDIFFHSMAETHQGDSIAVVLSGTGTDGSKGIKRVKELDGQVLVQDPDTAKFDGMPRSAISSVDVDLIASPERLADIVNQVISGNIEINQIQNTEITSPYIAILDKLYELSAIDFRDYKPATVERRIQRRIQLNRLRNINDYLNFLSFDTHELNKLKQDILIPVSSFFRDTHVFQYLKTTVIPSIIRESKDHSIRIWIAGCATGQEAYSYSILFYEAFQELNVWPQLKIFATDIEQENIDFASNGVYPESATIELGEERTKRFFIQKGKTLTVRPEIRQNIIFAKHNLLVDPPFTKTNLVSCRNTLIYFEQGAQQKAISRFKYSLNKLGFLVLGSSESLGNSAKEFTKVNAKLKVFRFNADKESAMHLGNVFVRANIPPSIQNPMTKLNLSNPIISGQNILISSYAPPSFLVDSNRKLIHLYGSSQKYLQFSDGAATLDISKLLLGRLAPVCLALLHKSIKENITYSTQFELKNQDNQVETLLITVRPISIESNADVYYLLTIEPVDVKSDEDAKSLTIDITLATHERIQSLEADLAATRDSLQATIEELETSNEELQATNEELMASNEELQSTNEELQSVNEELYTVNSENQERIEILNRLNSDLENITKASHIPTIFLDNNLHITRFTNEISSIFRIRPSDIGRPIGDFSHELDYQELITDVNKVIFTDIATQREIRTWNNRWYLVRILPYKESKESISNGVVITFVEITYLKDYQRLQAIIDSLPEHIAVLDNKGIILLVNKSWRKFAEENGDRGLVHTGPGVNYLDVCKTQPSPINSNIEQVAQGIREVMTGVSSRFSITYPCHSPMEQRWFLMHCSPVEHIHGGLVISHINITDWVKGGFNHELIGR